MKKLKTEAQIVLHYLAKNKSSACFQAVYAQVKADRQMRQSVRSFFASYAGFFVVVTVNNIEFPFNREIAVCGLILTFLAIFFFGIRTAVKFLRVTSFCGWDRAHEGSANSILEVIHTFKKLFGRWPARLGIDGVTRKLTRLAKRILKLGAKGKSDAEYLALKHLKAMFNAAQELMPVPSYDDIFAAARAGKKRPDWIMPFKN